MKSILTVLIVVSALLLASFKANEKTFVITFTEPQINAMWDVVNQSNAPHQQVEAVKALIMQQYQAQIKPDSSKKK